ncbi:MAG: hypothetical protein RL172_221, partial [Bacteroidota bacterium]
ITFDLSGTTLTINGALTITSTNASSVRFGGTGVTTISAGTYVQTGGNIVLQSSTGSTTLTVKGSFTQSAATPTTTIDFVALGGSGSATLNLQAAVTKAAGNTSWTSTSTNTASVMTVQFSGTNAQIVNVNGGWGIGSTMGGRCNIINTNTDPSGVSVTGTLKVINNGSSAAATCTNSGNFTGAGTIQYSGTGAGANNFTLLYAGSTAQTASSVEFPTANAPYNLTINSNTSVAFPASFNRTVPGTLTLLSGGLNLGSNTLTLSNTSLAAQLSYTGGFITSGTLSRNYPVSGLPTGTSVNAMFPFGSGNNNRAVYVYFSGANLTGGTAGYISVSHTAAVNASVVAPTYTDNGVVIDKRTNSDWKVNTGTFDLGSGGTTISMNAQGNNIGSVDNVSTLRLINGTSAFGLLIPSSGSNDAPLVGKSGLLIADVNNGTFYIGSDNTNVLQIVTFTWSGTTNSNWTTTSNWTGGVGYPSAPTEVAIINSGAPNMPNIPTGTAVSVYQLTLGAGASLTMTGTASLSVYDAVTFSGTTNFANTSTFIYASSNAAQNIINIPSPYYGNLGISGAANKIFPSSVTITGDLSISGAAPDFTTNSSTVVYEAGTAAIQRVAATNYYNLTFAGNRGGRTIRLGNGVSNNTINLANNFIITATNYVATIDAYNTFNFSSAGAQAIPGFTYGTLTNTGNGPRTYDNQGSADATHVVKYKSLSFSTGANTMAGSKLVFDRSSVPMGAFNITGNSYYDFEIAGNLNNSTVGFFSNATVSIAGTFTVSATNFKQSFANNFTFNFNGTGNQTIPAFKTITASNTPAWKFDELTVTNAGRVITIAGAGTDTLFIGGAFTVPSVASFTGSNGFVVAGSTVNFNTASGTIPVLRPSSGTTHYNNIVLESGTRNTNGDLNLSGNFTVRGTDAAPAQLTVNNGAANRYITIAGDLTLAGTSASSALTSLVDFNAGSPSQIRVGGNVNISGAGQLTTLIGTAPGSLLFNGATQQYSNTSSNKNGFVNFIVGDGTNATAVTLNHNLELLRSDIAPFSTSLVVANNASLNTGTKNITIGTDDNGATNAAFTLNSGATLITSNTGVSPNTAIEGLATDGTTGTILANDSKLTRTYSPTASYVLNAATTEPFPSSITSMANLTIGAAVSLNRDIVASNTLNLTTNILTQAGNDLTFSGLASTTGSIYADKNANLSITGTLGTVGTLRFATGGNTTGQFTINRAVTVALGSDLTIDPTPGTGNFITGTSSSILNINGNTLTINGAISGSGFLAGTATSNLALGGTAGSVKFATGTEVLKDLTLNNSATASLGTILDITAGTAPNTAGTLAINNSAVLTTGGNLTLKSNANGTARVAPARATGGYISGDVTVERFLPSVRAWRFLAAPAYGQTIKQAWQENQATAVDPGTGFGTLITSSSASFAANGFDYQTPGNSLLGYVPATNTWNGYLNTFGQIATAGGNSAYMLFSRGDRSVTPSPYNAPTTVLLRSKGSLYQGDLPAISVPTAGQFAAIGNNYASAIDFTALDKTNIDNSFRLWDPKMPGAQNLGAWVTFSASSPTPWEPIPSSASGSYTPGVANTKIESGQAFMVKSTAGGGSLTFRETSKASGSKTVARPLGNNTTKAWVKANLYNMAAGEPLIVDGNVAVFASKYADAVDADDAGKMNNFGENFGILRNNLQLVVEARQPVKDTDTIFYNMKKMKQQAYRLELTPQNFDAGVIAYVEDSYLRNVSPLNMGVPNNIDFTVNAEAASAAADRFRVMFKPALVLPVTFTDIMAVEKSGGIFVEWSVENEIDMAWYEIEESADGRNFTKAFTMAATAGNSGGKGTYDWLDTKLLNGDNFYRIRSISKDGKAAYSRIVNVGIAAAKPGFKVFPNPVADGMIGLQMKNMPAGVYTIRILNIDGKQLSKDLIKHTGGSSTQTITSASKLISGTYQLEITGPDSKVNTLRILVL